MLSEGGRVTMTRLPLLEVQVCETHDFSQPSSDGHPLAIPLSTSQMIPRRQIRHFARLRPTDPNMMKYRQQGCIMGSDADLRDS